MHSGEDTGERLPKDKRPLRGLNVAQTLNLSGDGEAKSVTVALYTQKTRRF